jgi:uncharacterized protein (DUF58 family)
MTAGAPDKLACARKIAAALSYVARRDAVGVATFDETIRQYVPPAAGRAQIFRVFDTLRSAHGAGRSAIDRALTDYGAAVRGPGLAVVISDFYEPESTGTLKLDGLRYLLYRGLMPAVVQVVADEEAAPDIRDEVELFDLEDAAAPPLVVDRTAIAGYGEQMTRLSAGLEAFCRSHNLPCVRVTASSPFDTLVSAFRKAGLLTLRT